MKIQQAVILHGTDGTPEENWFPWLKRKFDAVGYQVWVPQLRNAHMPNREVWDDQILSGQDLHEAIVIGHSAGAVEVLNLLMNPRCPHIRLGVMVAAWPRGVPKTDGTFEWEQGQFDNLFPSDGFNTETIKARADRLAFLHGAKDSYCPVAATERMAKAFDVPIIIDPNAEHFSGIRELPELWKIIEPSLG